VRRQVAKEHFSRWPVESPETGKPIGYLLVKDLVGEHDHAADWTRLVRPMRAVSPGANIEDTLRLLQHENATICLVEEDGRPAGLFTIEDILEQVIGRIEDEYPRHPRISLREALASGGVVLNLAATTAESAIQELAAAIPGRRLPPQASVAELAIARERELHTDVGLGVAVPHARCAELGGPIVVFGRSSDGIVFDPESSEPVRLVFLLVTPVERPELQVFFLQHVAALVSRAPVRERLLSAASEAEVAAILTEAASD
jgi:mannitol/fructose-specific phosphotransferase system IIA component (Ntr-type)